MNHKRFVLLVGALAALLMLISACAPQVEQVEVTRIVEAEPEMVEVTRIVEGETVVEEVPVEVEVTRMVEVETAAEAGFPEGTELSILQWSHFVPQYDVWFDPFAEDWGAANGVDVRAQRSLSCLWRRPTSSRVSAT
jgi:hypothetical protein